MRICLVNYRYFVSGGPERYMFGVTKLLEDLGHEVIPFSVRYRQNEPSPWSGYFVEPIGRDDEVTFRQTSWRPGAVVRGVERAFYSREVYRAVSRLVEVTRPDVAFVLNYLKKLSPSVLAAFEDAGVPIVNRFSDFALICPQPHLVRDGRICEECVGRSLWPSVRYRCVQGSFSASAINALAMTYARRRRFFDGIEAFVTPSAVMREKMIAGGLPAERLHHIPTFVQPTGGRPFSERGDRICYVGRIEKTKGVHVLVEAFRRLRQGGAHRDLQLALAGEQSSAEGAALMDEVERSPVPGLRALGNLDQQGVLALLGESLVSVVPSVWYENTPNAVLESLATGTPVVASRLGSMRDMIEGTGAGELFVPGDPADLARVLDRLLSDRSSLEEMGARAQRLARERYSPDVHAQALVGLFEDVVSAHHGGANVARAPRHGVGKGNGRPAHGGGAVSSLPGIATATQRLRTLAGDGADGVVDAAIIVTYRCNAKCQMCHTWQFPTKPSEEFKPDLLRRLPERLGRVNITGGEPMLRKDIDEIVEILAPKARRLEISTNGYFTDRLVEIGRRHPEMTIRISLEGMPVTNDRVRGTKGGFEHALRSYHALRDVGVRDLGFAVTIQDANAHDLLALYGMVEDLGAEFAQAVPHNSYYFHTDQNRIDDIDRVQTAIRDLMEAFLRSRRPKEWFRAYLNRGLVDYVGGAERRLACTGGTDIFFLDPHGEVYPCNGWDISMGNLHERTFEEIWTGERAEEVRSAVCTCERRCWMTGTAVPAMRHNLPRVAWWVARNKARLALGLPVDLRD